MALVVQIAWQISGVKVNIGTIHTQFDCHDRATTGYCFSHFATNSKSLFSASLSVAAVQISFKAAVTSLRSL